MIRPSKTCWKAIEIRGTRGDSVRDGGRDETRPLDAAERLVALYRFQSGELSADHAFLALGDGITPVEVTDPADVDWDTFPVLAALEAVTRDELRRLRSLLRADLTSGTYDEPTPPAWDTAERATSTEI